MRLYHCLAYLLCAALLSSSALACDNVTIHIQHGGPTGYLIRYRITIGAFQTTGVLAEGASTPVQCLNSGQQVSVDVYEVNGTPVNYPASGSPQTYTSGGATTLNFTISGSAPPPSNWKYDAKTCNKTALPQYYDVIINGVVVATEGPINPGECFEFHYSDPNKKTIQFARRTVDPDGNRTVTDYSRLIDSSDPGWYNTGGGPGLQTGTDGVTHVPNADVSNPKIPWDDSKTSPATDDSVRKGFESLYGLQSQSAQQGANENRAQTEKLTAVENSC